ncbi:MAG TPA: hypothetical protein VFV99_00415 [Kofleriaceae bacterium]|nr:hypothetical protein [Kofleriaceae bacterium]
MIKKAGALERKLEEGRVLAEQLRAEAEHLRESQELARQRSEASRVHAELGRADSEETRELREDMRRGGERLRRAKTQREQTSLTGNGEEHATTSEISPALRRAIREEVRAALTQLNAKHQATGDHEQ